MLIDLRSKYKKDVLDLRVKKKENNFTKKAKILKNTINEKIQLITKDLRKIVARLDMRNNKKNSRLDLRKTANTTALNISPINIERKQISNRAHKIEIRRDGELLGDLKYEVYPERNVLYVNYIEINEPYRKNGLAMLLYREFSEDYNSKYNGWRILRTFINPIAEYTYQKAVAEGLFPPETLNDIKRDYNIYDEELWYNELQPKLIDLRNKNN